MQQASVEVATAGNGSAPTAARRKLVLVAEDQLHVREQAATELRRLGFGVLEAGNGREAIELAAKHGPDLVVLDIAMPQLGGLEASARLGAPVIFISAGFDQIGPMGARVAEALAA